MALPEAELPYSHNKPQYAGDWTPRAYQHEMLLESLRQNTIVAMDTGSGKTNVAILRIAAELERLTSDKRVWFLCPTVALATQQAAVLSASLPSYSCRLLSGGDRVDAWSNQQVWDDALLGRQIVVCTHAVLKDALVHAFVSMADICLLVFDEAHHCANNHPAALVADFYRASQGDRPAILGLTASPVVRKSGDGLTTLERNLNAIVRTPMRSRDDLMRHVHPPSMLAQLYIQQPPLPPNLLRHLESIYQQMDIQDDPYVKQLKQSDSGKYQTTVINRKTYSHNFFKKLVRDAGIVLVDLGPRLCEDYILACVDKAFGPNLAFQTSIYVAEASEEEKRYIRHLLAPIRNAVPQSDALTYSSKVQLLLRLVVNELRANVACIIFVETRAEVFLIDRLLSTHPTTRDIVRSGTFVGMATTKGSASAVELLSSKSQKETLSDLALGRKNVIVCTIVCEEGIDISACNLVICFQPPPNLKAFVQRRGRARDVNSKYIIMLPEGNHSGLVEFQALERRMIADYMNDMRNLDHLASPADEENVNLSFVAPETGAKITIQDAMPHLHHFCNKLPGAKNRDARPIFTSLKDDTALPDSPVRGCLLTLPASVDANLREHCSNRFWHNERMAHKDAAFQALLALYNAGLLDGHFLPSPAVATSEYPIYQEIKKRPPFALVGKRMDPWPNLAAMWQTNDLDYVYKYLLLLSDSNGRRTSFYMLSPCQLPRNADIMLHITPSFTVTVSLSENARISKDEVDVDLLNRVTKRILISVHQSRMLDVATFPLQYGPFDVKNLSSWLNETNPAESISAAGIETIPDRGCVVRCIIPNSPFHGRKCILEAFENDYIDDEGNHLGRRMKCRSYPKRTDFLHPMVLSGYQIPGGHEVLDPSDFELDMLPIEYINLARFVPAIQHVIEVNLVATHLSDTILKPIAFSAPSVILPAICTPQSREAGDYERLEFLGDTILKFLTSLTLMAVHPTWHEGYLSNWKDQIVSNGRLATAAKTLGIVNYIIHESFTGLKWRPLNNETLLNPLWDVESKKVQLSTKTCADVCEALIGTAFLDKSLDAAVAMVQLLIPELEFKPVDVRANELAELASVITTESTPNLQRLETLLDQTFANKSILLESITHVSHTSPTPVRSYDRLEFLGDALLDYFVTTTISKYSSASPTGPLPVNHMTILKSCAVNASFLAYRALSTTISVPAKDVTAVTTSIPGSKPVTTTYTSDTYIEHSLSDFLRHTANATYTAQLGATRARFNTVKPLLDGVFAMTLNPETQSTDESSSRAYYPWSLLAALNPEKYFSDIVESTLAAVWVDTRGSFAACEALLRRFGILTWLEAALALGVDGLHVWPPKHEVAALVAKMGWGTYVSPKKVEKLARAEARDVDTVGDPDQTVSKDPTMSPEKEGGYEPNDPDSEARPPGVQYEISLADPLDDGALTYGTGRYTCRLSARGRLFAVRSGWSKVEVETTAAEAAIVVLREELTAATSNAESLEEICVDVAPIDDLAEERNGAVVAGEAGDDDELDSDDEDGGGGVSLPQDTQPSMDIDVPGPEKGMKRKASGRIVQGRERRA